MFGPVHQKGSQFTWNKWFINTFSNNK